MDSNSIIEKVKELIQKGNVSRVIVRKEGKEVINIPVNVGLLGGVFAPKLVLLGGVLATVGFGCEVEIVKTDGEVMNVVTEQDTQKVRDVAAGVVDQVRSVISPEKTEEADFEEVVSAEEAAEYWTEEETEE